MRSVLMAASAACTLFIASNAYACGDRYQCHNWRPESPRIHRSRPRARMHVRRPRHVSRGVESHRGGLVQACAGGVCGTVIASAKAKFEGLFRDLIALGYKIGTPGCYSPHGHMRHSLHHSGRACDLFNQYDRNRTRLPQPPRAVQIELAAKNGLTAGAGWCSPDGGHFDLSGYNGCHAYARAYRHSRHMRMARR